MATELIYYLKATKWADVVGENFNDFLFLAGPIPLRVREASVPVVNDNECVRKINAVTEKIFILPASSFCAGGEEGHDACQVIKSLKKDASFSPALVANCKIATPKPNHS